MPENTARSDSQGTNAPAQLMQMLFGFMTSQAISVAAELGLADLLKNGPKSPDELAQATGARA
ncbi:MAG TPA: methyltransferase dimerization domain-containing protein [Nitrosospira sp.]|nr:methyltransferase dimerization domain-containing protein [Nitrosospira sp.]